MQQVTKYTPIKQGLYPGILQNRKEKNFVQEFAAIVTHEGKTFVPVTLRVYLTNAVTRACVWIYAGNSPTHPETYTGAGDNADGYNFNHLGTAAELAINRAGFTLAKSTDGQGAHEVGEALHAIAQFLYPEATIYVHHAHA